MLTIGHSNLALERFLSLFVSRDRADRLPEFQQGIRRLAGLAAEHRVAVVCGEENPARCHRRFLVTPSLMRVGIEVRHIRADGRVQSDDEVEREASGSGRRAFRPANQTDERLRQGRRTGAGPAP